MHSSFRNDTIDYCLACIRLCQHAHGSGCILALCSTGTLKSFFFLHKYKLVIFFIRHTLWILPFKSTTTHSLSTNFLKKKYYPNSVIVNYSYNVTINIQLNTTPAGYLAPPTHGKSVYGCPCRATQTRAGAYVTPTDRCWRQSLDPRHTAVSQSTS